ncbi:hypothetical protein [Thiomicrorhabdus lithotrophica]|uniref:Uncharacterized protein n=1 Tax=Thiomicrorhabdus lithotrophica TaxID=2949997 RepID=A0ABY8C882_9GAMM|nr:hypothetical protein [Thiomicrorhabdus lithotrophica]WEJ62181.1 hypothetical protein NR989_09185 [Thiomicrorhabdus lithotrophica]
MSATREQWAAIIMQVMQLLHKQNPRYNPYTFEQAKPSIVEELDTWTIGELNYFIMENLSHDTQPNTGICDCARLACACIV